MSFKRAITWTISGVLVAAGVALWWMQAPRKSAPPTASLSPRPSGGSEAPESKTGSSLNPARGNSSLEPTPLGDSEARLSSKELLPSSDSASLPSLSPLAPTLSESLSPPPSSTLQIFPSSQKKNLAIPTDSGSGADSALASESAVSQTLSNRDFRSAPTLQQLLQSQIQSPSLNGVDLNQQKLNLSALTPQKITSPGKLDPILLDKVELDPLRVPASPPPSPEGDSASPSKSSSLPPTPPNNPPSKRDPRGRLLSGNGGSGSGDEGTPKNPGEEAKKENKEPPTAQKGEGDTPEEDFGGDGPQLSLAKPYCFLLPRSSPAVDCAKASVKAIVEEYARADVQIIPVFRWWGDDYPRDPQALESAATEACNLEKAFPWTSGGKMTGSIQAFVEHPIPSKQCKIEPPKPPTAAGCSSVCPDGPSFSTVSQDQCSPAVSVHESGHSNCCGRKCHNEGDEECRPENESAGCGLCLDGSSQTYFLKERSIYLADKFDGSKACSFTPGALQSLRQGASPNPGYKFKILDQYQPSGNKSPSIYGQNGIRKVIGDAKQFSKAPPKNLHELNRGEGRKPAANSSGNSRRKNLKDPKTYTPEQIRKMVVGD